MACMLYCRFLHVRFCSCLASSSTVRRSTWIPQPHDPAITSLEVGSKSHDGLGCNFTYHSFAAQSRIDAGGVRFACVTVSCLEKRGGKWLSYP